MTTDKVQRISGMIGFARRAGKTVIGTELVCRAMPKGEVKLIVISNSASDSTKKKLTVKSAFYGISWVLAEIDTERLGARAARLRQSQSPIRCSLTKSLRRALNNFTKGSFRHSETGDFYGRKEIDQGNPNFKGL